MIDLKSYDTKFIQEQISVYIKHIKEEPDEYNILDNLIDTLKRELRDRKINTIIYG